MEAAGCGPAPLNTVGASLPTPSNLPCPKEGTIAQEAAGPSKTGTTTLTAGEAEEEEEEHIFFAMSSSIRRVQLSPAMLEDEARSLRSQIRMWGKDGVGEPDLRRRRRSAFRRVVSHRREDGETER